MARTLVRPSIYEEDFLAWTEQQAALLRAGRLDQLDLDNLAEELDTMGRSEWGELESRLEVLLVHMLKRDQQPEQHTRSSDATINQQRTRLRRLFRRSPSVRRDLGLTIGTPAAGPKDTPGSPARPPQVGGAQRGRRQRRLVAGEAVRVTGEAVRAPDQDRGAQAASISGPLCARPATCVRGSASSASR